MKVYLTNGVIIEGSIEEIKEYLGDQIKENKQNIINHPYISTPVEPYYSPFINPERYRITCSTLSFTE